MLFSLKPPTSAHDLFTVLLSIPTTFSVRELYGTKCEDVRYSLEGLCVVNDHCVHRWIRNAENGSYYVD